MALTLANGLGVDDVFRFVQFVANKESRGWISPEEFLIAAEVAQLSLYSELEALYAQTKKVHASLRPFESVSDTIIDSDPLPSRFRIPIIASVVGGGGTVGAEVKEIEKAELPNIITSSIVAPSLAYPIYYIDGENVIVYIIPDVITIKIDFLRAPIPPVWGYTVSASGRPVYAEVSSTNFGFDPSLFTDISMRILANIGINIGKEEITQYAIGIKQKA